MLPTNKPFAFIFSYVLLCACVGLCYGGPATAWDQKAITPASVSSFSFALIADPHLGDQVKNPGAFTRRNDLYRRTVEEINAMKPLPDFVVLDGDLVEHPTEENYAVFTQLSKLLKPVPILVHGNHDGRDGVLFSRSEKELNGSDRTHYSFDCGKWHFIVLPSDLQPWSDWSSIAGWLEQDLSANRSRPTMVFMHYHLLPVGITEPEFYTYPMDLKNRILAGLTKYRNVKYVFSGHVHSGIQPSIKAAWTYKGTSFIFAPTGVPPRNFGEEYPEFTDCMNTGGYYNVVRVEGDKVTISGRAFGHSKPVIYPSRFKTFTMDKDPRAFCPLPLLPASANLTNGGFENGLRGWGMPHRYVADKQPGFVWDVSKAQPHGGRKSAYLCCREKGTNWSNDEFIEQYQLFKVPAGQAPVITAAYRIEKLSPFGGGYVRVSGYKQGDLKCFMMFKWGAQEDRAGRIAQVFAYTDTGDRAPSSYLLDMARDGMGFFWKVPSQTGEWHTIEADIQHLYDECKGQTGAFQALGVDRLLLAFGVWAGKDPGSDSAACFDDFTVSFGQARSSSTIDGRELSPGACLKDPELGKNRKK